MHVLLAALLCFCVLAICALVVSRIIHVLFSGRYEHNESVFGRTFLITGATSGIGLETAKQLFRLGGDVLLLCRDVPKGEAVARRLRQTPALFGGGRLRVLECELSSLESVRTCAAAVLHLCPAIHVLICNAGRGGVRGSSRVLSEDGLELTMAANYFGHFLLTVLLLPRLRSSAPSRVVNVSSIMHLWAGDMSVEQLNFDSRHYSATAAYCQSKMAQILAARHLANKLSGSGTTANALHPGIVLTPISRYFVWSAMSKLALLFAAVATFAKTPAEGAQTTLFVALSPTHSTGRYYADCAVKATHKRALDDHLAAQVWARSCQLVRVSDPFA